MASVDSSPHALVVPASGQGHANACMHLSFSLAHLGFHVHFVYFSSDYASLQPHKRPPSDLIAAATGSNSAHGFIHIHVLEDEYTPSPSDLNKIFVVTPAMKENLFNLILQLRGQGTPPACLISDTFLPWTHYVAQRAGIPRIDFCTANAMWYLLMYSAPLLFDQGIFPEKVETGTPLILDHIPGMPPFSSELYPSGVRYRDVSHPVNSVFKEISSCANHAERILIHTMSELEPDAFQGLQAMGLSAYAVGPLFHHTKKQEAPTASSQAKEKPSVSDCNEEVDCISWLDMQAESSVIYIAFGTMASFSMEEIHEVALGLEASGSLFLWVIRKDLLNGAELPKCFRMGSWGG